MTESLATLATTPCMAMPEMTPSTATKVTTASWEEKVMTLLMAATTMTSLKVALVTTFYVAKRVAIRLKAVPVTTPSKVAVSSATPMFSTQGMVATLCAITQPMMRKPTPCALSVRKPKTSSSVAMVMISSSRLMAVTIR